MTVDSTSCDINHMVQATDSTICIVHVSKQLYLYKDNYTLESTIIVFMEWQYMDQTLFMR